MKNLVYLFVFAVSIFFTACSSNEQDIMPISPQFDKAPADYFNKPYRYLQSFTEINNVKVEYLERKDGVILLIHSPLRSVNHLYAVIEQQGKDVSSLVYLGISNEGKYLIKGLKTGLIRDIRIYGIVSKPLIGNDPFPSSTILNKIVVIGWTTADTYIKVKSSRFPAALQYLFAELTTVNGSLLVFLNRPAGEDFEIPRYGELGIINMKIFGYSPVLFTKN